MWDDILIFTTQSRQYFTFSLACKSGYSPQGNSCKRCDSGYFSFGVQSECQPCSLSAEFQANSTHESQVVDMLCPSSWVVAEFAADSLRHVAEATGANIKTVAIVLGIFLPLLFLSFFVPLSFALLMCLVSPFICCCVYLCVKKKRRKTKVIEIVHRKQGDTEVGLAVTTVTADTLRDDTLKES